MHSMVGEISMKVAESFAESCVKVGMPITDDQRTLLVGSLAPWFDWWERVGRYQTPDKSLKGCKEQ